MFCLIFFCIHTPLIDEYVCTHIMNILIDKYRPFVVSNSLEKLFFEKFRNTSEFKMYDFQNGHLQFAWLA